MSSGLLDQDVTHPLVRFLGELESTLAQTQGAPAWTLTPPQLTELLPRLARAKDQIDALALAMLREADRHQIGEPHGFANTEGWWAAATRTTKKDAHRQVALAERLDASVHEPTSRAIGVGAVSVAQAAVILDAVDALPSELVDTALRSDAEQHLVALAEFHDPRELRILGRRILDVLAPEISEEHQRRVLEREEQHAAATATFTMSPDGHGSVVGRFKIPVLAGAILRKHLDAIAAPKHQASLPPGTAAQISSGGPTTRPLRLGHAFVEYLETRAASGTPKAGGIAATIVVTMTLESLLRAGQPATLDTGEIVSASEARRLACEAGLVPAVLGSRSQILDLGRKTRFHTEPQRIALAHRDRGCAAEHCDWPPGMCHAHHPTPWSLGGGTSVDNGMLLCPRHHAVAHDARFHQSSAADGSVRFSRHPEPG